MSDLKQIAKEIRATTVQMAHDAPSSHVASALSCVDILVSLFFSVMKEEDRFILSKGHGCMSYYAVLAKKGFFPKELLKTYSKNGSKLPEHPPSHGIPGIEIGTGSLGHGLSISLGAALARKIKNMPGREFVLLSDGECNEGSVWEAAMVAAKLKLNNLVAIVDYNKMQCNGFIDDEDIVRKWSSFGWHVYGAVGNDIDDLLSEFKDMNIESLEYCKPTVLIAQTIKGSGVSFMEDDLLWHYRPPDDKELAQALKEIQDA